VSDGRIISLCSREESGATLCLEIALQDYPFRERS